MTNADNNVNELKSAEQNLPVGFQVARPKTKISDAVYDSNKKAWLDPETGQIKMFATWVTDVYKKEWDD